MPKTDSLKVYNTFVGGLVTEATPLTFPENATQSALNCIFDKKIIRRFINHIFLILPSFRADLFK